MVTNVSYRRYVQKVECANHAVKCYQNRLEALYKEHPHYHERHGLSDARIKRIAHSACCARKLSATKKKEYFGMREILPLDTWLRSL